MIYKILDYLVTFGPIYCSIIADVVGEHYAMNIHQIKWFESFIFLFFYFVNNLWNWIIYSLL